MKTLFFFSLFSLIFTVSICAQTNELNVIPQPKTIARSKGEFKFNFKTKIVATDDAGRKSAGILNDLLMKNYGFKLEYTDKPQKKNYISIATQNPPEFSSAN